LLFFSLILILGGCDAFVRKFTRKPNKDNLPKVEMVLAPEEYKQNLTKEELYRQYFLYWKSWSDELIEALLHGANHKKQVSCANEALKNLAQLRVMLNDEMRAKLDQYIFKLNDLKDTIAKDIYNSDVSSSRLSAERMKMRILREFSYPKVKDSLI
jgi:hypothetical protein